MRRNNILHRSSGRWDRDANLISVRTRVGVSVELAVLPTHLVPNNQKARKHSNRIRNSLFKLVADNDVRVP